MSSKDIIYSINIEDLQTVAQTELGRELSIHELRLVISHIGDRIKWYDLIASIISEEIESI